MISKVSASTKHNILSEANSIDIASDATATIVSAYKAKREQLYCKSFVQAYALLKPLTDRFDLQFHEGSSYKGDGLLPLKIAGIIDVDFALHELGHAIDFASRKPTRLAVHSFELKLPHNEFGEVELQTTAPVENELTAMAIQNRLLEFIGMDKDLLAGQLIHDADNLVNSYKINGMENIPTTHHLIRSPEYKRNTKLIRILQRKRDSAHKAKLDICQKIFGNPYYNESNPGYEQVEKLLKQQGFANLDTIVSALNKYRNDNSALYSKQIKSHKQQRFTWAYNFALSVHQQYTPPRLITALENTSEILKAVNSKQALAA